MRREMILAASALVASSACTALLGATAVPDPDAAPRAQTPIDEAGFSDMATLDATAVADAVGGEDATGEAAESAADTGGSGDRDATSGCGALDTPANCGSCGVACDKTTGVPSCNGSTCSYACNPGRSDCNAVSGPDTDGCECTTPVCCGSSCQTLHDNGAGQTYYDCYPVGTINEATAMDACAAYERARGADGSACSGDWTCNGVSTQSVCNAECTNCWSYQGANAGQAMDCGCPSQSIGPWQ